MRLVRVKDVFYASFFMSREKLSVWIGLCGNGELIGPFFFEGNVNGKVIFRCLMIKSFGL